MNNHIDIGILDTMDELTLKYGTRDPYELIDCLGFRILGLYSSVIGYVAYAKGATWIGLNRSLSELQRLFTVYHELTHAVEHLPKNGDNAVFQESAALFTFDKNIAQEEEEANIVAADFVIPTEEILELTGYNTRTVRRYIELMELLERKKRTEPEQYTRSGQPVHTEGFITICREIEETKVEIAEAGLCHTKQQMARLLGYHIGIIDYKMRALQLRGYAMPEVELLDSKKVFEFDKRLDY